MKYLLDIQFTDEERDILTILYGVQGIEKYLNDLNKTIEISFKLLMNNAYKQIMDGGDVN